MQEYTPVKSGKVREIYDIGDCLIITATDRISAFDHILNALDIVVAHIRISAGTCYLIRNRLVRTMQDNIHLLLISKFLKKCGQSVYIRTFGLGLPSLPIYAECPHRYVRTFAIFRKVITMVQD